MSARPKPNDAGPPAAFPECCAEFVALVETALAEGNLEALPDDALRGVMTAAVKAYAAKGEASETWPPPVSPDTITPTEVVIMVSEMIRAADLNLFDVSMWYRRAR